MSIPSLYKAIEAFETEDQTMNAFSSNKISDVIVQ